MRIVATMIGFAVLAGLCGVSSGQGDRQSRGGLSAAALFRALDRNGDGVLSPEEVDRAPASLRRLDANGDGAVVADELGLPGRESPRRGRGRPGGRNSGEAWKLLLQKYDQDKDGKISKEEYTRSKEKFAALDRTGDGVLTQEDLRGRRRGPPGGGRPEAPQEGEVAPDFTLSFASREGDAEKATAQLTTYRGVKPVALIFGSYT